MPVAILGERFCFVVGNPSFSQILIPMTSTSFLDLPILLWEVDGSSLATEAI
jgi:hypothetical protein